MDLRPLLPALAVACAGAPAPTGATGSIEPTGSTGLACAEATLLVGDSWESTTEGQTNASWSFCGGGDVRDASVVLEASEDLEQVGIRVVAEFDTVLRLADACTGEELTCADEPGSLETLSLSMVAGQQVLVTVDGRTLGDVGPFTVLTQDGAYDERICDDGLDDDQDGLVDCEEGICSGTPGCTPECPMRELTEASDSASTVGRLDQHAPDCVNTSNAPDVSWSFTAPQGGRYEFRTRGSDYDTVLSALDGCDGKVLACNDDDEKSKIKDDLTSVVEVQLAADQTIVLVVDGYQRRSGTAQLTVTRL